MGRIVCPKCERDDQIQRVSSIVTGGVSTTSYVSGGFSQTAVSQTQLAKRLSPPDKPKSTWNREDWSSFSGAMVIIIFGAVVGAIFQTIAGAMGTFPDAGIIPIVIGFFVPMVGLLWLISSSSQQAEKDIIPNWKKQISNWCELYYCHRDDCVFDPRTNKHTSPEGMDSLL